MVANKNKPKIVVVGAGFGGIYVAKGLIKSNAHVTIIDRQNHHLFQPLLYQVAGGILSAGSVATPIRAIIGKNPNTFVRMESVIEIDRVNKKVITDQDNEYDYDYLVLATGSTYDYFGNDAWKKHTFTLKTLKDAVNLRNKIYSSIEKALTTKDPVERERLLSFVVIGGGPTGVEMAGVIAEVTHKLTREELKLDFSDIHIYLIEAMDRVLGMYSKDQSEYAKKALEKIGVKVRLNSMVKNIEENIVETNEFTINAETIVWAAGVKAVGAPALLDDIPQQRNKRIKVNKHLQLVEDKSIFVLGDSSYFDENDRPLPGLGSVAKQQGEYLAQQLKSIADGKELIKEFSYKDLGIMATIGRNAAVANIANIELKGFLAWLLWGLVHILLLISFRNRLWVFGSWIWTYLLDSLEARNINSSYAKDID
jgi:NADH:ubiquinone reductase (H+-translocating)